MRTHEPKRHKCDVCGRSFGLFIRLATHKMTEHNIKTEMTPIVAGAEQEEESNAVRDAREPKETKSRSGRSRIHSEAFDEDNAFDSDEPLVKRNTVFNVSTYKNAARCAICHYKFSDHTTMLMHLQTHSETYLCKNFTCHVCKKSFKEKWQLLRHEISHNYSDSTPVYTCNVCNKTFIDNSIYKAHQKTHVIDKTYHCSKCNKLFFKEVSLLTHQCTGDPLLVKKNITSKSSLQNNNKKYKCSKCNASFNNAQSRNSHMKTHAESINAIIQNTSIKQEPENESMPTLKPETSLEYTVPHIEPKVEIKEESIQPPVKRTLIRTAGGYRCGVCQSPFVLRELAVAHLRSAHPLMPYQCPYCKKRFTTQYTFTHHIKTDHLDEPDK